MGSSRVEQALNELDPGSRAVVDLSLGTDFSDENIATLIRVEPDEVARRRDRAIDSLQQKLGGVSHDDVVFELCAAMGVEPSETMLEGATRNGAAPAPANGAVQVADAPPAADEAPEDTTALDAGDAAGMEPSADEPAEPTEAEDATPELEPEPVEPSGSGEDEGESEAASGPLTHVEPEVIAVPFEPEADRPDEGPGDRAAASAAEHPEPEPAASASAPPPATPGEREPERSGARRRVGALLAALVAGAIVIAGVVALSSGGEGADSEPAAPQAPAGEGSESPTAEPSAVSASLDPLPDAPSGASAEVELEGDELTVTLDGLPAPEGSYEAWLFTSVLDSSSLGTTDDGSGTISAELPASADRYEYLDVSIQPAGGDQHSGQSIFRVPVSDLLG